MPSPPTPPVTRRATAKDDAAAAVGRALAATRPIVTQWRDGLTVIALDSELKNYAPDYLTLDQASSANGLQIQEAAQQTVPSVDALTGPMPVLILGGDTIIGGAQNRIINLTILLKAAATTAIPVTCLEHGRWNRGGRFTAARQVDHAMRSMVAEQVTRRARAPRSPSDCRGEPRALGTGRAGRRNRIDRGRGSLRRQSSLGARLSRAEQGALRYSSPSMSAGSRVVTRCSYPASISAR